MKMKTVAHALKEASPTFFLMFFIIGMLCIFAPLPCDATTTTINKQVNITAVTIVNNSGELTLETIRVENMLFTCTNNICEVWVPVEVVCEDCDECPNCPSINFTEMEGNLTAEMKELRKWRKRPESGE